MADAPVLWVIDPVAGATFPDGRDLRVLTKKSDASLWALGVARNALWLIAGQWRYDVTQGIEYAKILGETPDIRFVEESMRRTLAPYFTVQRLSAKQTGGDLIVSFVGRVGTERVEGSFGFLEGLTATEVRVLGYKVNAGSIVIQFSEVLSEWNLPSPSDFEFRGFAEVPTITGVSVNGQALILNTTGVLFPKYGEPKSLVYSPNETQQLQSATRLPVGSFRMPMLYNESPFDIGAPVVWARGDNPNAVIAGGVYQSIPNGGTLGGSVVRNTGAGPTLATIYGKNSPDTTLAGMNYANLTALQAMHQPLTSCTLALRVSLDANLGATTSRVFASKNVTDPVPGFLLDRTPSNRLRFRVYDTVGVVIDLTAGPTTINEGTFDIVIRKTDHTFEIFVNGVLYDSGTASALAAGAHQTGLQIGAVLSNGSPTGGRYPEWFGYETALTTQQMTWVRQYLARWDGPRNLFTPSQIPGLLLHWKSDDANATIAAAKYSALPTYSAAGPSGTLLIGGVGPDLQLSGGLNVADFTAGSSFNTNSTTSLQAMNDPSGSATIAGWVRFEAAGVSCRVIASRNSTAGQKGLLLERTAANRLQLIIGDGTNNTLTLNAGATTITTGVFFIAVRRTGLLFEVFVNSVAYASGSASALVAGAHAVAAHFGGTITGTAPVPGEMGEFTHYGRALSNAELLLLLQSAQRFAPQV